MNASGRGKITNINNLLKKLLFSHTVGIKTIFTCISFYKNNSEHGIIYVQ